MKTATDRGVTIFVTRQRCVFLAGTAAAEGEGSSAGSAARRCAAAHFDVPEHWIELEPTGPHTLRALVVPPVDPRRRALLVLGTAAAVCAAAFLALFFGWGGGR